MAAGGKPGPGGIITTTSAAAGSPKQTFVLNKAAGSPAGKPGAGQQIIMVSGAGGGGVKMVMVTSGQLGQGTTKLVTAVPAGSAAAAGAGTRTVTLAQGAAKPVTIQMPGAQTGKTLTLVQAPTSAAATTTTAASTVAPTTTSTSQATSAAAPVSSDADLAQLAAEAGLTTAGGSGDGT